MRFGATRFGDEFVSFSGAYRIRFYLRTQDLHISSSAGEKPLALCWLNYWPAWMWKRVLISNAPFRTSRELYIAQPVSSLLTLSIIAANAATPAGYHNHIVSTSRVAEFAMVINQTREGPLVLDISLVVAVAKNWTVGFLQTPMTKSRGSSVRFEGVSGDVDGRSEDPAENMEITPSCVSEPNPQSSPMDVVSTRPEAGDGWRMVGVTVHIWKSRQTAATNNRQTPGRSRLCPRRSPNVANSNALSCVLKFSVFPVRSPGSCSTRASMPMSSVAASASTSSGTDSVVYVFALNEGSGKLEYKIGSTGHTPETRLREWRRGHQSKGFRLVYSVKVVGRNTAYVVEHEAHQQILQYATKIHRSCPDCLVVHQEEFVMELDFGLEDVRDAVDTAKRLVETRRVGCT
ncbi:hypothetical protein D9758_004708 [Tetrapyrgos nigripes]|uniref:Bacteriophage T5 Orf172 DNA-binding domain-containing protein n=1 Tax=Tetrapyrgos nigripes TaxID=182062 RepID=A0A8H5H039_9AGAR|nr:hypothetical protein D9758_004708 [Tetrapyrgos nigripes]